MSEPIENLRLARALALCRAAYIGQMEHAAKHYHDVLDADAALIDALTAENDALRAALQPFADAPPVTDAASELDAAQMTLGEMNALLAEFNAYQDDARSKDRPALDFAGWRLAKAQAEVARLAADNDALKRDLDAAHREIERQRTRANRNADHADYMMEHKHREDT